jgi:[ribosomal protein S18]-alanine N-acetyltransferase
VSPGSLLRRAVLADVPALAALEAACFTHPWTPAQIHEEVARVPPDMVLVLEGPGSPGGAPAGIRAYCSFRLVVDEMHVMNMAVHPGYRRQGLARRLLAFAMARAARAGARRALLELRTGNREALALYASLGFRSLGVRREYYREPTEDALVLAREPCGAES